MIYTLGGKADGMAFFSTPISITSSSPQTTYNVLLIITDGVITDMADTERAIVEVGW